MPSRPSSSVIIGPSILLLALTIVDTLLADGRLVTPFDDLTTSVRGYFLIVEPSARSRPAVLALERWLLDEAGASAAGAPSSAAMPPG
jgi:DNA-binding transcriptional LysR family regulator